MRFSRLLPFLDDHGVITRDSHGGNRRGKDQMRESDCSRRVMLKCSLSLTYSSHCDFQASPLKSGTLEGGDNQKKLELRGRREAGTDAESVSSYWEMFFCLCRAVKKGDAKSANHGPWAWLVAKLQWLDKIVFLHFTIRMLLEGSTIRCWTRVGIIL